MLAAISVAPAVKLTAVTAAALNAASASLRVRDMAISSRFQTTCMDTDSTLDPPLSSVKQRLYGPAMRPESKWVGPRLYGIKPLTPTLSPEGEREESENQRPGVVMCGQASKTADRRETTSDVPAMS